VCDLCCLAQIVFEVWRVVGGVYVRLINYVRVLRMDGLSHEEVRIEL
jgi:hypothetical protein